MAWRSEYWRNGNVFLLSVVCGVEQVNGGGDVSLQSGSIPSEQEENAQQPFSTVRGDISRRWSQGSVAVHGVFSKRPRGGGMQADSRLMRLKYS